MQAVATSGAWPGNARANWRVLGLRTLGLVALFGVEVVLLSGWLDGETILSRPGLAGWIGSRGAWILRLLVGYGCLFLALSYLKYRTALAGVARVLTARSIGLAPWLVHGAAMIAFAFFSARLFEAANPTQGRDGWAVLWLLSGVTGLVSGLLAFASWEALQALRRATGQLWWLAAVASACAVAAVRLNQALWATTAGVTFRLVELLLRPLLPTLRTEPETLLLRAPHFAVRISPECSGLEGVGLFLIFGLTFLWLFKDECRFPQAWTLLPVGALLLFGLNSVRIAVLLLIGEAGAKEIARGGFHSQAGWMAFNAVAFLTVLAARRLPWFSRQTTVPQPLMAENATAVYLMPFLTILAAGMLASAGTGKFEWLYPLRVVAVLPVLWSYRRSYRALDWRVGWPAMGAGGAALLIWVGVDTWVRGTAAVAMPRELSAASDGWRNVWLLFRMVGAAVTVPLAEELAFRGFLLRRLEGEPFEEIAFARTGLQAVLISSVAFGLMHGGRWPEGIAAGLLYAWATRRTGRISEAIAAHALTNALLAVYVLRFEQWQYW